MTIITKIEMGRALTPAETDARDLYMEQQVANQVTNGKTAAVFNSTSGIRAWSTMEAANAFIAWANANYAPPPLSIVVQTV